MWEEKHRILGEHKEEVSTPDLGQRFLNRSNIWDLKEDLKS